MEYKLNKKITLIILMVLIVFIGSVAPHSNIKKNKDNIEYDKVQNDDIKMISEEKIDETSNNNYTEEDKIILAKVIVAEAGCSWFSKEHKLLVGSVVLNRVEHEEFPQTIKDVIYADGQYASVKSGKFDKITPTNESLDIAEELLKNGSTCPNDVVFQAEFRQGDGVYKKIYDDVLKTTTYFCYKCNKEMI